MQFGGFVLRRVARALLTVFGSVTLVFLVLQFAGDPVATLLPSEAGAEDFARMRAELGLDRPFHEQYLRTLTGSLTGDFGYSFRLKQPAAALVLGRLQATLQLTLGAFVVGLLLAVPLGVLAARYRNSWFDVAASGLSFVGFSIPSFWLGTMAIIIFAVQLRWLPTSGIGTWKHLVLPVLTLAAWPLGQLMMLVRAEMLGVLSEDYIRAARAKGVGETRVVFVHALRNATISLITMLGLLLGQLLGGAIVTETVFAWPGMGRLAITAIFDRDWPLVQASVVYTVLIFVGINLLVDLLYTVLDPRLRFS
jgi:peptide/nickel transport system permease protein